MAEFKLDNPIHLALGRAAKSKLDAVYKDAEVPVGAHKIGGYSLTLVMEEGQMVIRTAGDNKDGTDDQETPKLKLTVNALLLYLAKEKIVLNPDALAECLRADLKEEKIPVPNEAAAALSVVQGEFDKVASNKPAPKKTAAQCPGAKDIPLEVARTRKKAAGKWAAKKSETPAA